MDGSVQVTTSGGAARRCPRPLAAPCYIQGMRTHVAPPRPRLRQTLDSTLWFTLALALAGGTACTRRSATDAETPEVLRLRARDAWRTGDAAAMTAATAGLARAGAADPELEAMATLLRATPELRRRVHDAPATATFDPAKKIPIIDARAGGAAARVVFDTGAEMTVVDAEAARRWGVVTPPGATVQLAGNAGTVETTLGVLPELEILGITIANVPVVIADLSALRAVAGPVDAILGPQDLLATEVIRIDYPRGTIERLVASRDEGHRFTFLDGRTLIGVTAGLSGTITGTFEIDSGGRRSTLTAAYVERAEAQGAELDVSVPEVVALSAIGTASRSRRFLGAGSLCLDEPRQCFEISKIPIDTTDADQATGQAGKLGADVLAGHIVEIDYPARRLRIEPGIQLPP
jgi:hypothetical protein